MGRKGNTYLRRKLPEFRRAALHFPVLVLTDLDRGPCAADLVADWLGRAPRPRQLALRVAVREIEAWLLADRVGLASFLGVSQSKIPPDPEGLPDPKGYLLNLAKAARREIRHDLCPARGSRSKQGLGYNTRMRRFVESSWSPDEASLVSDSLARARRRIAEIAQGTGTADHA